MRLRRAGTATLLAAGLLAAPAAGDDPGHHVTASCDWYFTGQPDTSTVLLAVVAESHVQGHDGLFTNDVECTAYTPTEAVQLRSTSTLRDQTAAGGGVLRSDPVMRTCVRAFARWAMTFDPSAVPSLDLVDTHRADYSDPPGCLPPCHVVPAPSHCPAADPSKRSAS